MNLTPRGCSSIGGELALCMERTRDTALGFFASYGYNPFNPAEFQLLEGTMKNLPRKRRDRIIALNTPFGEPCCLRADITISALSYMSTHYAPEDFPLRLCYAERIFSAPTPPKENLEDTQIGVELLGWESPGSDVEVVAMLMRALDRLGLDRSVIVLGDASILPGLLRGLPSDISEKLIEQLQDGAYCDFMQTVKNSDAIPPEARGILLELPWLKGSTDVLEKARNLFGSPALCAPLGPLATLCGALESLGYGGRVRVDLGFIRDLNYYRGPIFNVYSSEEGELLGGGGRYDGTLAEARFACQAIGFGLSLRELAIARKPEPESPAVVVWPGDVPHERAILFAEKLAEAGASFLISWEPEMEKSRAFARNKPCGWWVNLRDGYSEEIATGRRATDFSWVEELLR